MKKRCLWILATGAILAGGVAHAATIYVTPSNLQGWTNGDIRFDATASIANFADGLGGSGALEFNMPTANTNKAEWQILGDFGLLSDLTHLSYNWYRDASSNNSSVQVPVLRLIVQDTAGFSYMIYEPAYNAGVFTEDVWHATNTNVSTTGNFWAWRIGSGAQNTYTTVSNYIANTYGLNDIITENARVVGFNLGVGSGWNGSFLGYVDHLSFSFNAAEATTWDFEPDPSVVPVPAAAPLGLVGMGLIAFLRRRKKATAA